MTTLFCIAAFKNEYYSLCCSFLLPVFSLLLLFSSYSSRVCRYFFAFYHCGCPKSVGPKPHPSKPHPCNRPQAKTEVALQFLGICAAEVALQHPLFCSAEVIVTKSCAATWENAKESHKGVFALLAPEICD